MDYVSKFKRQLKIRSFLASSLPALCSVACALVCSFVLDTSIVIALIVSLFIAFLSSSIASWAFSRDAALPVEKLADAITYAVHPDSRQLPEFDRLPLARELVDNLSRQIYNLASTSTPTHIASAQTSTTVSQVAATPTQSPQLIDGIGLPIIGIDSQQKITVMNKVACEYFGVTQITAIGQMLYDVLPFSFQGDETLEEWLASEKTNVVTATRLWERVRFSLGNDAYKQFDLVASISNGAHTGAETMLAVFDRTDRYNKDDQEISFVALAVHELRTPLTIMRGYIEVFEDELGPHLSPEMTDFMHKMHASAQQLTAFVGNILNVARVEENQLALKLREEEMPAIVKTAITDLQLRAKVHGKTIELTIDEALPTVAADRISVHEVINNLVDNAIKYSGDAEKIVVKTYINEQGLVETSVQDFGIGIPASVMPELFKKFHRSHKSRVQIGGTGLGLYLCKALITAHGGNIWVRSKEGEGSIFSFTLLPYSQVAKEQLAGEDGIIRGAHGWIKNHSLYRN